jgi:hypothetical protein
VGIGSSAQGVEAVETKKEVSQVGIMTDDEAGMASGGNAATRPNPDFGRVSLG